MRQSAQFPTTNDDASNPFFSLDAAPPTQEPPAPGPENDQLSFGFGARPLANYEEPGMRKEKKR